MRGPGVDAGSKHGSIPKSQMLVNQQQPQPKSNRKSIQAQPATDGRHGTKDSSLPRKGPLDLSAKRIEMPQQQ